MKPSKFYVVEENGSAVGCETSLRAAKALRAKFCDRDATITLVCVEVSKETVRRMLGNVGGYAESSEVVA